MKERLKGTDIILALDEIRFDGPSWNSSMACGGTYSIFIKDCKEGYYEDPNFEGKIRVLRVKKNNDGTYSVRISFEKEFVEQ